MTYEQDLGFNPDDILNSPEDLVTPEELTPEELQWFSGAFEIGGSMGIGINKNTATPYMRIQEGDEELINKLKARFGGGKSQDGNSYIWILTGRRAAEIMIEMEPYLVSREELSLAAYNWLQAGSSEEKIQIALDIRERKNIELTDEQREERIKRYTDLVQEGAFMAGAVDHRGNIFERKTGNTSTPQITLRSTNEELLIAIERVYGGSKRLVEEKGKIINIANRENITKNPGFSWTAVSAQARNILHQISPYLKVPPYEGWDIRYIDEYRTLMQEQIVLIEESVLAEIEAFHRGEVHRLRTIEEIAQEFNLSPDVIDDRMTSLPDTLRKEREEIQRRFRRRSLTRDDVEMLQARILQEVQDFIDGKRERMTRDSQLAEEMGVSEPTIKRHVVRHLAPEVRTFRSGTFISENTRANNEKYGNPAKRKKD